MQHWSIRDAKDHLSRLIDAAQAEPQAITKHGRESVVVLSKPEYDGSSGIGSHCPSFSHAG
jgi:prevent-host-death family protein